ncbi:hypothetical protein [Psychrobacillus sp. L4]|uniref:hypothetical protein n=1 Tax=Psychrobacillus sp. L4 TaxID=3236892 RepID=UPI0036F3D4CF
MKKYPYKNNINKVIEKYIALKDIQDLLKPKGILISASRRKDIANLTKDYYLSQKDFQELKELLDSPNNFKKMGRYMLPSSESEDFRESLESLNGKVLNHNDNTKVNIEILDENKMNVYIQYEEQRPGLIELLETTTKSIVINVDSSEEVCNVNYSLNSTSDYKKVKDLLNHIQLDSSYNFRELLLSELETKNRTNLFANFFQYNFKEWEIAKITQIKIKKDSNYRPEQVAEQVAASVAESSEVQTDNEIMEEVILEGINSALLSGENLIENSFINKVLTQGFYFSMSCIRFDNKNNANFIDFVIDFKSRPERLETRIVESGEYSLDEQGDTIESRRVFSEDIQNQIINEFNDILCKIFIEFSQPLNIEIETEVKLEISSDEVS